VVKAVLDRVVLGPAAKVPPQWIQLWGSFALLKANYQGYQPVVRGCLYYSIANGHEDDCRKQWDVLLRNSGKGQVVAIGHCHRPEDAGTVRDTIDSTSRPDVYPVGTVDVITNSVNDATVAALLTTPVPLQPIANASVPSGKVQLVAHNITQKREGPITYHFELEGSAGDKEQSPPLRAGGGETRWTPKMELGTSPRYTWRVWVQDGNWKGPVAVSTITIKDKK
jgi:hypothetical protein